MRDTRISHSASVKAALLALSATGVGLTQVQTASADRVIASSTSGAGTTHYQDNTDVTNQSDINTINSELRNDQTYANGMLTLTDQIKDVKSTDVSKMRNSISNLSDLIRKYNSLSDQLKTQNETQENLNGASTPPVTTYINSDDIDQSADQLKSAINKMQDMVNSNSQILDSNSKAQSNNRALNDKIKQANQTIKETASDINKYHDGIFGDLDDVKRASDDSANNGELVVDNSATQMPSTFQTHQTVTTDPTVVTTIDQANSELDRILNNIKQQNDTNAKEGQKASVYRGNALYNINDINSWLENVRAEASMAQGYSDDAQADVNDSMQSYKDDLTSQFQDAIEKMKKSGASKEDIKTMEDNLAAIQSSSASPGSTINVSIGNVQFGDIGQTQDTPNGAQDGTIANTKAVEQANLENQISSAESQVDAAHDSALDQIQTATDLAIQALQAANGYSSSSSHSGSGSSSDTSDSSGSGNSDNALKQYMQTLPIYKGTDVGKKGGEWNKQYKSYMDDALSQLEKPDQALADKLAGSGFAKTVEPGTSIPKVAGAIYLMNAKKDADGKNTAPGFGSVMFKTANIFDYITTTPDTHGGGEILAMTGSPGDSKKIYDEMMDSSHSTFGGKVGGKKMSDVPQALQDWDRQYLDPSYAHGSGKRHNDGFPTGKYTFTVITHSPIVTVKLKNAYVYYDNASNSVKTSDVNVTAEAHAFDGGNINDELRKNGNPKWTALYIYNFAINPYNGQLDVNTGYIPTTWNGAGSGSGGHIGGGGGEGMMLDDDSASVTYAPETSAVNNNLSIRSNMVTPSSSQSEGDLLDVDDTPSDDVGTGGEALKRVDKISGGNLYNKIGTPISPNFAKDIGLAQTLHVWVSGAGKASANYSPVIVTDIDDNQELVVPHGPTEDGRPAHMVSATNSPAKSSSTTGKNFSWSHTGNHNPGATSYVKYPNNNTNETLTLGHEDSRTISKRSAALYSKGGKHTYGLGDQWLTLRNKGGKSGYFSIDTGLFAPFGFVGGSITPAPGSKPPKVPSINVSVPTMQVDMPNAQAYTTGTYNLNSAIEYLTDSVDTKPIQNMNVQMKLPTYKAPEPGDKIASSNTSLVVKGQNDSTKRVSSGNSLAVHGNNINNRVSSGNSLTVHGIVNSNKLSSGNSLVVRSNSENAKSSSGNSLTVRVITPVAQIVQDPKSDQDGSAMLIPAKIKAAPVVNTDNGRTEVEISVYSDPEIANTTKEALGRWQDALKKDGVDLKVDMTTNPDDLKNGVTIAVMNSVNDNELASSPQDKTKVDPTMNDYAGMTTAVSNDILTGDGENDTFNASGTITAGDTLKNSIFTIQLNSQGLDQSTWKVGKNKQTLMTNVLTHELGHVFGLEHNNNDSLMTTNILNSDFNGQISDQDAQLASESIKKDILHPADLFKNA